MRVHMRAAILKSTNWLLPMTVFYVTGSITKNGRQEYFSFNMRRFTDVGYLGTANSGELLFYTQSDDVIVQTFNDRRGDIDSMANVVSLPVKMIGPEDILLIRNNLYLIKTGCLTILGGK